ncbi:hypothetical protein AAFC00_005731 [Neodothiora populina]|uniref:RhoGAP-domain-containing protein n=1 Tax=Neodothiora populina TaxID=2781224 RepID=A0ABR3P5M8_9PEZI
MSESPDGDKLTDGDGLFKSSTNTRDSAETASTPVIAVSNNDHELSQQVQHNVDNVLYSDIGINTLLARLKQSVASAKDYAAFLKKRSSIEEDHAMGMRRLAKTHHDSIRKTDSRQGSYVHQLEQVMRQHERMADNGMQFALSVHQMHEDLNELSRNIELGRKHWKHEGLNAEKRATDAESAMDKAKTKYDGLAEEYDRARTGDAKGGRRLGLKGPKSAAQVEEDLLRKLQAADSDYQQKVHAARAQREELIKTGRPQAVKALRELINECDSGLALQLQKFATFNEKLLLGNGLVVCPLPATDGAPAQRSMKDVVLDIDNDRDFYSYILNHTTKIPVRTGEIQYKQHPTLLPKQQTPAPQARQVSSTLQQPPSSQSATVSFSSPGVPPQQYNNSTNEQHSVSPQPSPQPAAAKPYPTYPTNDPYSQSETSPNAVNNPPYPSSGSSVRGVPIASPTIPASYPSPAAYNSTNGAPGGPMGQHHSQNYPTPHNATPPSSSAIASNLPPLKPVFGVALEELFRRDGTAVPMVVYQCMQAVDLFGLDVEGIYRVNGTAAHVQQLKAMFDHDSAAVDFRNPTSFSHDINSVAGLLKTFFRDLPDPLLTAAHYGRFIEAGRIEDDVVRRDTVHAIINDLPDAHYATLRALVLHLERVRSHDSQNRMGTANLSICFAPTLMGLGEGRMGAVQDAGLQARVLSTILDHTFQIFDED